MPAPGGAVLQRGSLTVRVIGTELQLVAMTEEELRLRGRIAAVELRPGGGHV